MPMMKCWQPFQEIHLTYCIYHRAARSTHAVSSPRDRCLESMANLARDLHRVSYVLVINPLMGGLPNEHLKYIF